MAVKTKGFFKGMIGYIDWWLDRLFLFKVQTDGKLLFWSIIFVFSLLSEFRSAAMVEVLLSH